VNFANELSSYQLDSSVAMQPDNLVPLCMQIQNYYHIIMIVFTVNEHENICIAGLNRRAGYVTAARYNSLLSLL
jgi:hypothetical protein